MHTHAFVSTRISIPMYYKLQITQIMGVFFDELKVLIEEFSTGGAVTIKLMFYRFLHSNIQYDFT